MSAALGTQALTVRLGATAPPALQSLTLNLRQGEWTSIVGPNGAGKSTLLKALAGLLPYQGQIALQGRELSELAPRTRARRLAYLAQSAGAPSHQDDLKVYDLVLLGRLPHQAWLAAPSPRDHAVVKAALQRVHGWEWRDRALPTLSGGEQQRVLLARLLAVEAPILLMDEPLTNLDPPHQADWLALVRQLRGEGKTIISVLHELNIALMADEIVVLQNGQLAHQGAADSTATAHALETVFDQRIQIDSHGAHRIALPR